MNISPHAPEAHAETPRHSRKPAFFPVHFKYQIRQHENRLSIVPAYGIWGSTIFALVFFATLSLFWTWALFLGYHALKESLMWGLPVFGLAFIFVEHQSVTAEFAHDRNLFQAYRYRRSIQKPLSSLAAVVVEKNRRALWPSWGIWLRFQDGDSKLLLETGEKAARTIASSIAQYADVPLEENTQ